MDRLFNRVLVRDPSLSYKKCVSTNPLHDTIDISLAIKQHREYVQILKENEIEVIELPILNNHPDSVFMQDTSVIGESSKTAVICRFGEKSRRGEEKSVKEYLKKQNFKTIDIRAPGTIEGGDVLITDMDVIFIGESVRTNSNGIKLFAEAFPHAKVVSIKLTQIFHLLSGVNYLGKRRFAISSHTVDPTYFYGFKLIEIPKDELYANNMLYLGDNKVLIPTGYPQTSNKLKSEGFEVIEVDVSEFWKGDGGVTCLNSPFYLPL